MKNAIVSHLIIVLLCILPMMTIFAQEPAAIPDTLATYLETEGFTLEKNERNIPYSVDTKQCQSFDIRESERYLVCPVSSSAITEDGVQFRYLAIARHKEPTEAHILEFITAQEVDGFELAKAYLTNPDQLEMDVDGLTLVSTHQFKFLYVKKYLSGQAQEDTNQPAISKGAGQ